MPTKILQVNKFYKPWIGGVETLVEQIAEGLQSDFEMSILVCDDRLSNPAVGTPQIKIIKARTLGVLFSMPLSLEFFRLFKKLSAENDIIHLHHPFPLAALAAFFYRNRLKRKKLTLTYHSDIVRTKFLGLLFKPLLLWFLRRADSIATTSPKLAQNSKILSRFPAKTTIIPLAINADQVYPPAQKQDYCLFVGRLVGYKGLPYLIRALAGTGEKLKIVGRGPLEDQLKTLAVSLNLSGHIEFLGQVSDRELADLYSHAKIFILPSISSNEAFGIVQLEAMAHGLPIINTALPSGVTWVARNGQEAITVAPKNIPQLRSAIINLAKGLNMRERLGQQGKIRVEENFLMSHLVKNYKNFFQKISQ